MDKLLLIFAAVFTVASFKTAAEDRPDFTYTVKDITQKLDHFNYSSRRKLDMKYRVTEQYYEPGGPLFIFVGDYPYGNYSYHINHNLLFQELARENKALFVLHHRRHMGLSIDTLQKYIKYLTVEQQLADLSYFIRFIKKTYAGMENAKVILYGAEYAGSIAVWFKKLYADLVDGVWASGAPFLAKADFSEHHEVVGHSIKKMGGDACYNRIKNGFAELELMLANNRTAEVKQMFKLCPSFDGSNHLDVSTLFDRIMRQFYYDIHRRFSTIEQICDDVMRQSSDISGIAYKYYNHGGKSTCLDSSYRFFLEKQESKYVLPWRYNQCTQFGWFQTSSSPNQPFGSKNPLSFFVSNCNDLFGLNYTNEDLENNVRTFNDKYGGIDLNLENIYLSYGEFDPWSALGIHDAKKAPLIPSCVSGCDFWVESGAPELHDSYKTVAAVISKWLK